MPRRAGGAASDVPGRASAARPPEDPAGQRDGADDRPQLFLFGPPRTLVGGKQQLVTREQSRLCLYIVAVDNDGGPVLKARLASLIWPHVAKRSLRLNDALSDVRAALGSGAIVTDTHGVCWAGATVDVVAFKEHLADAAARSELAAVPALSAALRLYRGDFLEGVDATPTDGDGHLAAWIEAMRESLKRQAVNAALRLAEIQVRAGQSAAAEAAAQMGLKIDPKEGRLLLACAESIAGRGDYEGAVRFAEIALNLLQGKVGQEQEGGPCSEIVHKLKELIGVWRAALAGSSIRMPAAEPAGSFPLPQPMVGRAVQMEQLVGHLLDPAARLVLVTGAPSVGKSQLALHGAWRAMAHFPGGVYYLDLARAVRVEPVHDALSRTLGAPVEHGPAGQAPAALDTVRTALRHRKALVLLDNLERADVSARDVQELLEAAPGLTLLVTSRESRQLAVGQREIQLSGLALPDRGQPWTRERLSGCESVSLFVARAQAAKPAFQLSDRNAPDVAELCVRLDGHPLAIELAASLSRTLSPGAILKKLDGEGLLSVLVRPQRPGTNGGAQPSRLGGAIFWSFKQLPEQAQRLLMCLAVFSGGCTEEQVAEICCEEGEWKRGTALRATLKLLQERGLLSRTDAAGDEARITLLAPIREYALDRLMTGARQKGEELVCRHASYFVQLAAEAMPHLAGPHQVEWLVRLAREHRNLSAAARGLLDRQEREGAARLVVGAWRYYWLRGHMAEAIGYLDAALSSDGEMAPRTSASAHSVRGVFRTFLGARDRAREDHYAALSLWRKLGDERQVARVLLDLATIDAHEGHRERAVQACRESQALFESLGDHQAQANALNNGACVLADLGDLDAAAEYGERALDIRREMGDAYGVGSASSLLAMVSLRQGRFGRSRAFAREALLAAANMVTPGPTARAVIATALVASAEGRHVQAATLLGGAQRLRESSGTDLKAVLSDSERLLLRQARRAASRGLGEGSFISALRAGESLSLEETVARALVA